MLTKPSFLTKAASLMNQLNEIVEEIIRRSLLKNGKVLIDRSKQIINK